MASYLHHSIKMIKIIIFKITTNIMLAYIIEYD